MKHGTIKELLKRPIAYQPVIAKAFGSVNLGILWSQLYYWSDRTKNKDGWIYKTSKDVFEETALSRYEQDTARKKGLELGVIETKLAGVPAVTHYRIDFDKSLEVIEAYTQKGLQGELALAGAEVIEFTPGQEARDFFDGGTTYTQLFERLIEGIGEDKRGAIENELQKFILYWTEPSKSGKTTRWEMQKTFDIKRRIRTWLSNAGKFGGSKTSGPRGASI
jgi:hypothetical protein